MPKRTNLADRSALIAEWQSTGLSQYQSCQQHKIKPAIFAYWFEKCKIAPRALTAKSQPLMK